MCSLIQSAGCCLHANLTACHCSTKVLLSSMVRSFVRYSAVDTQLSLPAAWVTNAESPGSHWWSQRLIVAPFV
jgi:hypothetical protein